MQLMGGVTMICKIADLYVDVPSSGGMDKRCIDYCSCCKFCKYWQENYGKVDEVE